MERIETFQTLSSNFIQEIILGTRTLLLTFIWNSRSEAWYLTIEDEDSNNILSGIKLVPNWLLIRQYRAQLPNFRGDLIIKKTDEEVEDRISYENLGNGWSFFYASLIEAEQWEDYYGLG